MKRGNLRTVKKYSKDKPTRYAIEMKLGGIWRQVAMGGKVLIYDTEAAACSWMTSFIRKARLKKELKNHGKR